MTVTRAEIADASRDIFDRTRGAVSREDLITGAVTAHASPSVIACLSQLPTGTFAHLTDLWPHVNGTPVE